MSAPYEDLERIFHEPSRLAIVSELSARTDGSSFAELKTRCSLTDGNLSRHLAMLEKAGAVRIEKTFVGVKPRTTVFMTQAGRRGFIEYLDALERVLKEAAQRAKTVQPAKKRPKG